MKCKEHFSSCGTSEKENLVFRFLHFHLTTKDIEMEAGDTDGVKESIRDVRY